MIEAVPGNPWNVAGLNISVENLYIAGPHGPVTFATDFSQYNNVLLAPTGAAAATLKLNVTGNGNGIKGLNISALAQTDYGYPCISDVGRGNQIEMAYQASNPRHRRPQSVTRDGRVLHTRDSTSLLMGHTADPFVSGNDLLVNPLTIIPGGGLVEGTGYNYVADSTLDLGVRLSIPTPGGFFSQIHEVNSESGFVVGKFLPASRGRIYIKAKVTTAATQSWYISADAVTKGSATLSWATGYTVQSFDYDLTGIANTAAMLISGGNLSVSGTLDVAWVMFRPFMADLLVAGDSTLKGNLAVGPTGKLTISEDAIQSSNPSNMSIGSQSAGAGDIYLDYPSGGNLYVRRNGLAYCLKFNSSGQPSLNDGVNLALGTTTGTQIGTATTQKLALYGKTPIVQQGAITTPTAPSATYVQAEAQSMKTAVDAIRIALTNIGITA